MRRFFLLLALSKCCFAAFAQNPVPAAAQKGAVLIMGATAHIGNGSFIQNSAIGFENGKITLIADAASIKIDRNKYVRIFDATGKHVYPGFIAPSTSLGLSEVEAVRATQDHAEVGNQNPNARAIVAYNTDSDIIPTVRANGVLLAQIAPDGAGLSGSSSIVQLDAWNWEDASYQADDAIHLNWPPTRSFGGFDTGFEPRKNEQYEKDVTALRRYFEEARAYSKEANPAAKNPRFEAMRGIFSQKQALFIHVNEAKPMQEAVLFAESFGLKKVLVGADDAWLVADFLKSHNTPVVLAATHSLPAREDEDVDQPYKTPRQLHDKGVQFAFSVSGNWKQRNLPFQAGHAIGFGLPYEAAVSALTLNTAKILGIDQRCGSLETGKDATLFISEGDALDMRTCQVTAVFIQGREISLDNKHKQLNRRFQQKYNLKNE